MAQKVKKQHYVPQCYLNAWKCSPKHQIFVYDKETDSDRINNIQDVASERYFYDVNPAAIFPPEYLETLRQNGFEWNTPESSQFIERTFANGLESFYSKLLKEIITNASSSTPWHIKNCFFISEEKKAELSAYLAFQFIRLKRIRNGIKSMADCITQVLRDMGASESTITEYSLSKDDTRNIHARMLLDIEGISDITRTINRLTWMMGINGTKTKLYTSDNPIGTRGHINDPIMSMNGIASRGVEVFFPVSPELILIMLDGSYHTMWTPFERRYIEITDEANIDYYNSILAIQADRFIFSSDGKYTLLKSMIGQNKDVFKQPHMQMTKGNKTFYPAKE